MKKRSLLALTVVGTALGGIYRLLANGALTLDTGLGRRTRTLGPLYAQIAARPEVVFDVIANPYLDKTPHAMQEKLHVLERGSDMVLAAHFTDIGDGRRATTVETVCFERPHRISFRLVRGPVPHVVETFDLQPTEAGTTFTYTGEMGADYWGVGEWWAGKVAAKWEHAVAESLNAITAEAERLGARSQAHP